MSYSSQPQTYSTISDKDSTISIDQQVIDGLLSNIELDFSNITITGGSTTTYSTVTMNDNIEYSFNWGAAEEWVDSFPDWQRIQNMCKKYPGLEIALRNFQTVYTLVKDDYDNPKDEK
jgi:hypothetical protein